VRGTSGDVFTEAAHLMPDFIQVFFINCLFPPGRDQMCAMNCLILVICSVLASCVETQDSQSYFYKVATGKSYSKFTDFIRTFTV
jgi:hypothetical protein